MRAGRICPDVREVEIERDQDALLSAAGLEQGRIWCPREPFRRSGLHIVAEGAKRRLNAGRKVLVELEAKGQPQALRGHGNDALSCQVSRVCDRRKDVLGPERGVLGQDRLLGFASGQVVEDDGNRDACAMDAHGTMQDLRVGGDVLLPVHGEWVAALDECPSYSG